MRVRAVLKSVAGAMKPSLSLLQLLLLTGCFTTTTVRSGLEKGFVAAGVRVHDDEGFTGAGCEELDRMTYAFDADDIGGLADDVAWVVKSREARVTDVRVGGDFFKFKGKPDCAVLLCADSLRLHQTDVYGTINVRYWACPAAKP